MDVKHNAATQSGVRRFFMRGSKLGAAQKKPPVPLEGNRRFSNLFKIFKSQTQSVTYVAELEIFFRLIAQSTILRDGVCQVTLRT